MSERKAPSRFARLLLSSGLVAVSAAYALWEHEAQTDTAAPIARGPASDVSSRVASAQEATAPTVSDASPATPQQQPEPDIAQADQNPAAPPQAPDPPPTNTVAPPEPVPSPIQAEEPPPADPVPSPNLANAAPAAPPPRDRFAGGGFGGGFDEERPDRRFGGQRPDFPPEPFDAGATETKLPPARVGDAAFADTAAGAERAQTALSKPLSDGEFTGDSADTTWGAVQIKVVVKSGRVVEIDPLDYPSHRRRSLEISNWSIPRLERETLTAQRADIDLVSQATTTSYGYRESLASALAQASVEARK
jgi:uncharacterized protein with FMN-binding domain